MAEQTIVFDVKIGLFEDQEGSKKCWAVLVYQDGIKDEVFAVPMIDDPREQVSQARRDEVTKAVYDFMAVVMKSKRGTIVVDDHRGTGGN